MSVETKQSCEQLNMVEIVAKQLEIDVSVAENLAHLLEVEDCTVPFIARYRKEQTRNMEAGKLRQFQDALKELRDLQKKANTMVKNIAKQGKLNEDVKKSFMSAQTMDELILLYAPYKGEQKHSLADRARSLGLEEAAFCFINNLHETTDLRGWVVKGTEGRATLSDVERGVKYLVAEYLAKHQETLEKMRRIFQPSAMTLVSKLSTSKSKEKINERSKKDASEKAHKTTSEEKYKVYFDFCCRVDRLQSYQILALNRGEAQKQLNVKIVVDDAAENRFLAGIKQRWLNQVHCQNKKCIIESCVDDAYKRLIKPLVIRRARSELTKSAQHASTQVFGRNLKKLLLTAPLRGKIVLGVDPGYKNGCKCAVVSSTGNQILGTDVFYLNRRKESIVQVRKLYDQHKFELVAIGNGTACRETEQFFSSFFDLVKSPDLVYCIVSENGASIYSVTEIAEKEMPDLDPTLRSAVSIARRLQDPLVELVKIEPKHLGVGMYQHDIPETLLKASLGSVVEDCVTFVGVDLNVAGAELLKHIAGLKATQVEKILQWRKKHGSFINRKQLLDVSGIGAKTFQQCAGFVRISPSNIYGNLTSPAGDIESSSIVDFEPGKKRKLKTAKFGNTKKRKVTEHEYNPLDQTWIHPESYEVTEKLLDFINCSMQDIGKPDFIARIKNAKGTINDLTNKFNVGKPTLELILEGLAQPSGYRDIRQESSKPLYRRTVRSLSDIRTGETLRGRITNVTDFGAFVDVGVGRDGLIHCSQIRSWERLKEVMGPNDVVTVMIRDCKHDKLSLKLINYENERAALC